MTAALMDESQYRRLIDETFEAIDRGFEPVDPDVAESVIGQGTLTVTFADGKRLILSPQTPVRQLWVAFRDRAWHFDRKGEAWIDDRGQGIELRGLVKQITREQCGLEIALG
ncbi:MAG TPA: iron donor protein CyaY [Polyangia bacterium]